MRKRLWSAILALCMALTMAPTVAFAADDVTKTFEVENGTAFVDALNEINAAAEGNFVIKLTDNITVSGDPELTANTTPLALMSASISL